MKKEDMLWLVAVMGLWLLIVQDMEVELASFGEPGVLLGLVLGLALGALLAQKWRHIHQGQMVQVNLTFGVAFLLVLSMIVEMHSGLLVSAQLGLESRLLLGAQLGLALWVMVFGAMMLCGFVLIVPLLSIVYLEKIFSVPENEKDASVVGLMVKERYTGFIKNTLCLCFCIGISLFVNIRFSIDVCELIIVFSIAIVAITAEQLLLKFRIRKGYYGKNIREAKKIIEFIQKHASDSEGSSGGGKRKIFHKPGSDSSVIVNVNGGEYV